MYAIIDIETTGGRAVDKITEIAIYIHDGIRIVDEFATLINPEINIPNFITKLTGINNEMVAGAPKFFEVAKKIVEITADKIFVAHNVAFDYRFVQNEFKSLGYNYRRKTLCTVQLSRKLVPALPSYSLGRICDDLGIVIEGRHRAAGDAFATTKLFEYLLSINNVDKDLFSSNKIQGLNNLHPLLDKNTIENLPEETGVYYLYNDKHELIYIGKSKNVYSRVMTHFANTKSRKAIEMRNNIADISYELTGSELIALLLESAEIKQNIPLYNRSQRRTIYNYGLFMFEDENNYQNLKIKKIEGDEIPLTSFESLDEARDTLEKIIDHHVLCQKLCHLHKTDGACFFYTIQQCKGACIGEESPETYNKRVQKAISYYQFEHQNFLIIDKGRSQSEKSIVMIENGTYKGFGFFDFENESGDLESLKSCIRPANDNRDIRNIIRSYLKKFKVEKIVKFGN